MKDEWVPGAKVVYTKNQAYVPRDEPPSAAAGGKHVYVDRFEWHYIPDHQSAMKRHREWRGPITGKQSRLISHPSSKPPKA